MPSMVRVDPRRARGAAHASALHDLPDADLVALMAASDARQVFDTVCSTCHGMDGKGHGPASANLNPKPRNYTDKQWQSSVTDDQIAKTILLGGAAVGKSPVMPAQPQLRDKPEVVAELVRIVRGFGK